MGSYRASEWAQRRFGDVAENLGPAVAAGIQEAHRLALRAHLGGELSTNDTYGATLQVTQHQQLIAATADVPGVVARKPTGVKGRFPYVVVEDVSVVLLPWRFTNTRATRRVDATMPTPVSHLRKTLFGLGAGAPAVTQLVLEQSTLDDDQLEALLAEEQEISAQLASFGRVVTVAFGSNPTDGLFELGWGDAELISDETGHVHWHSWESLPVAELQAAGLAVPAQAPLRAVDPVGDGSRVGRFDAAPLNDDLGLTARPQPVAAPLSEMQPEVGQAGGEDVQS
ncbi:hypothetical protein [Trujillonella endophytica]|uniref:Uncharacterized protein n=1 Tax=Trujillonella endophytica TaxID=673521 RepID=A0A1H8WPA4_9ACTN|nr:hypothetical protein [Trujillella endophytica]SEP29481.1 hypothetical protein SAMN05660991_04601 [Trujillella endophytica]